MRVAVVLTIASLLALPVLGHVRRAHNQHQVRNLQDYVNALESLLESIPTTLPGYGSPTSTLKLSTVLISPIPVTKVTSKTVATSKTYSNSTTSSVVLVSPGEITSVVSKPGTTGKSSSSSSVLVSPESSSSVPKPYSSTSSTSTSSKKTSSIATSTIPSGTAIVSPNNGTNSTTCYSGVKIILARGTFEPQGASLAESPAHAILDVIPDSNITEVVYPASSDFGSSVPIGITNAKQQISDYHAACPNGKIVLMGYSQGAWVIGDVIAGGGYGPPIPYDLGDSIAAIIQFGDPFRVLGVGTEPDTCTLTGPGARSGASLTNLQHYAPRLDEYCNAGDPVCCTNGTSFAAHLSYVTTEHNAQIASFVSGRAGSLRRRFPRPPPKVRRL